MGELSNKRKPLCLLWDQRASLGATWHAFHLFRHPASEKLRIFLSTEMALGEHEPDTPQHLQISESSHCGSGDIYMTASSTAPPWTIPYLLCLFFARSLHRPSSSADLKVSSAALALLLTARSTCSVGQSLCSSTKWSGRVQKRHNFGSSVQGRRRIRRASPPRSSYSASSYKLSRRAALASAERLVKN